MRTAEMRMRDVLQRKESRLYHRCCSRRLPKARRRSRVAGRSYPTIRPISSNIFHILLAGLYRFVSRSNLYLTQWTSSRPHSSHRAMRTITAPFFPRRRVVFLALGDEPPRYSRTLSRYPVCHTRQCSPDQKVPDPQSGRNQYGDATAGGGNRSCLNLTEVPGRIVYFVLAVGRAPPRLVV